MRPASSITIEYKNDAPIELIDLTTSLAAIGDQYKRFVTDDRGIDNEARLFVHEIRPGSTIAELVAYGKAAADLYDGAQTLSGFAPYIYQLLQDVLHLRPAAQDLDKPVVRNTAQIVRPTAIDSAGQLNLIENNGGTVNVFSVSPQDAAAIAHNADHLLNSQLPHEELFTNEPMVLFQLRDAPPGRTGDFGIIDRFDAKRPRKLFFASDPLKETILHGEPFNTVFWVDGVAKTAGGKVEAYVITKLRDTSPREG